MEGGVVGSKAEAAKVAREIDAVETLLRDGLFREGLSMQEMWDGLWASFRGLDEDMALGACFNLLLVRVGARGGFLITPPDFDKPVYERAQEVAEKLLAVVPFSMGVMVCLPEKEDEVRRKLRGTRISDLDLVVGQILSYLYAGTLRELHKQKDRFGVCLRIEQSTEEGITCGPSEVFSMVGTTKHPLGEVMSQALELRDLASTIGRNLHITFQVFIYDENDHRVGSGNSSRSGCSEHKQPKEQQLHEEEENEQEHVEEHVEENALGCCTHPSVAEPCKLDHAAGTEVMHLGHKAVVLGDELHCEHCVGQGEKFCVGQKEKFCHKNSIN
jgi:hypothetical protein